MTYQSQMYTLHQCDAVEALRQLGSGSIDLLITDPAYESLEKHRAHGTTTRLKHSKSSSNDWFKIFPNSRFPELFAEVRRVLKPDAHFYLYCDQETMFVAKPMAERAGFTFWKPLVWDKLKIGMGYHYRCRYEFVLFFEKGKRWLRDLGVPDVIAQPRIKSFVEDAPGSKREAYPTEKPPEVSEVLVAQSAALGELVCDPFCGSGSVGVAALRQGCRFIGFDVNPDALALSASRLNNPGPATVQLKKTNAVKLPATVGAVDL